jgi:hypothetical protein
MTLQTSLALYIAAGIVGLFVGTGLDGSRGMQATAVAWTLCLATLIRPPMRPRVAAIPVSPRITREQRVMLGALPIRLVIVFVAAAVVYRLVGERLGAGFWIALLVFYPVGLALSVTRTLAELKRPD